MPAHCGRDARSPRMSRGFICATFGVAMTLFSWFSPWAWPAWPALTTMRLLVGTQTSFADLSYAVRGAVVVLLIIVNVGVWAAIAFGAMRLAAAFRSRSSGWHVLPGGLPFAL